MKKEYLKEIDSISLRCTLFDLDNAYNKFFKEKIGFPKYNMLGTGGLYPVAFSHINPLRTCKRIVKVVKYN